MDQTDRSLNPRQVVLYFGLMSLLVNLVNIAFLLDIPTSYMLKNILQLSPSQIALFRLLTAIPVFVGFTFGLVRDVWSPLGLRDLGYFRIFVPLMVGVLAWMAFSPTTMWACWRECSSLRWPIVSSPVEFGSQKR